MNTFYLPCCLTLALGLVATTAIADCGDDSENLLQSNNCDFDSDPAGNNGWQSSAGSLSYDGSEGYLTNGSGVVEAVDFSIFFAGNLQAYGSPSHPTCVEVTWDGSESSATAGIYVRQVSGSASCTVSVSFRPGAGIPLSPCAGTPIDSCTSAGTAPTSGWTQLSCDATSTGSPATGIVFTAACDGSSAFEVGFDNAFVRPGVGQLPVELEYFTIDD